MGRARRRRLREGARGAPARARRRERRVVPLVPRDGCDDVRRPGRAPGPRRVVRHREGRHRRAPRFRGAVPRVGMASDRTVLTAEGAEIARYKGYQPPAKFLELLRAATAAPVPSDGAPAATGVQKLSEGAIAELSIWTEHALDALWDRDQGGWGSPQKLPLAWDNAWTLEPRAPASGRRGDPEASTLCARSGAQDHRSGMGRPLPVLDRRRLAAPPLREARHVPGRRDRQLRDRVPADGRRRLAEDGAPRPQLRRPLRRRGRRKACFFATMRTPDLNAHDLEKPFEVRARLLREGQPGAQGARRSADRPARVSAREWPRHRGAPLTPRRWGVEVDPTGDTRRSSRPRAPTPRSGASSTHGTARGGVTSPRHEGRRVARAVSRRQRGVRLRARARLSEATHDTSLLGCREGRGRASSTGDLFGPQGGGFYASTPDASAVGVLADPPGALRGQRDGSCASSRAWRASPRPSRTARRTPARSAPSEPTTPSRTAAG